MLVLIGEWGFPFSYLNLSGCVLCIFPFHEAVQVLDLFRDQFIEEMDANAVVLELLHNNIIDRGDERRITMTLDPTQQNQFLHLTLKEKCTEDAFVTVCDIITAVKGNPKMKSLGESMKRRLETGGYICVWGWLSVYGSLVFRVDAWMCVLLKK